MKLLKKQKGMVRNVRKAVVDGITFDSRLEAYLYELLKQEGIPFELKPTYVLQDKFNYTGESIRKLTITPDFLLTKHGYIADPKGLITPVAEIKFKLLKRHLKDKGENYKVVFLKNRTEVENFINAIKANVPYVAPKKKKTA